MRSAGTEQKNNNSEEKASQKLKKDVVPKYTPNFLGVKTGNMNFVIIELKYL